MHKHFNFAVLVAVHHMKSMNEYSYKVCSTYLTTYFSLYYSQETLTCLH